MSENVTAKCTLGDPVYVRRDIFSVESLMKQERCISIQLGQFVFLWRYLYIPGKTQGYALKLFFFSSYVTKPDFFFFFFPITAFSSIPRHDKAHNCVMLRPREGRPNLVIDKWSRSSVTVSVFLGQRFMSAAEETILNFSWIKLRVNFNPRQGKDADSTKKQIRRKCFSLSEG